MTLIRQHHASRLSHVGFGTEPNTLNDHYCQHNHACLFVHVSGAKVFTCGDILGVLQVHTIKDDHRTYNICYTYKGQSRPGR